MGNHTVGRATIEPKEQKPVSEFKAIVLECLSYIAITFICCIFFAALIGV